MAKKNNGYKKVKEGIYLHPKYGRVMEHHGYSTRIFWSTQMLDYLKRNFATTLNDELAGWLGVSMRTMIRKARQLGLQKDPTWLHDMYEERRIMARAAASKAGNPGRFKKGVRANPAGEFKKGHKETPEMREKRIAGLHRWNMTHKKELSERSKKTWETRRAHARGQVPGTSARCQPSVELNS